MCAKTHCCLVEVVELDLLKGACECVCGGESEGLGWGRVGVWWGRDS